ncbi:MAG: threonine-phosphate decarboxylase CobD [Acidiferrobacterales bacterium]
MLEHGGGIIAASGQYGIPIGDWLDLSTGINPNSWPVPEIPAALWRRLPEHEDGLIQAAAGYYQSRSLLPVAGSQAAIQIVPRLRGCCRVGVLAPSYSEHQYAWSCAGHSVVNIAAGEINAAIAELDVLVLCNPNNPTAVAFPAETLLSWHAKLASKGGWLVVDEAFIDATPELSVARHAGKDGLIVLRSMGKFFGLAGIRTGFVFAWPQLLNAVQNQSGPWAISGPARWIASLALQDRKWQVSARESLAQSSAKLQTLLSRYDLAPAGSTLLFSWIMTEQAAVVHEMLARQGILTRYFAAPSSIRFGLPGSETERQRLEDVLGKLKTVLKTAVFAKHAYLSE